MTDAHCHVSANDLTVAELLVGRDCFGFHPWDFLTDDGPLPEVERLRAFLREHPFAGIGEIGLDRLKVRLVPERMRTAFERQLTVAAEFERPVTLHGAKCWGEVVRACRPFAGRIPAFLFHGFSRSDGLLPDIAALNGFVSVGPAVLNDHAVNYRELVRRIPDGMLLLETDRTEGKAAETPSVRAIAAEVAALRGLAPEALEALTDANARRFSGGDGRKIVRSLTFP